MSGAGEAAAESSAADFYVAPDGNDKNAGSESHPFATLARARDGVRALKQSGQGRDFRVLLRGGTYRIRETILFSMRDSAVDGHTITYAAYPGETPVLTPGVPVTEWRKLDRSPADLPAKAHGRVWAAPVPAGVQSFRTLYDGVRRLPRARSEGFRPLDEAKAWYAEDQGFFHFPEGSVRAWPNLSDVEVVIVPVAPWTMNILPLASVDEEAQLARTTIPGSYPLTQPRFGNFPASAWIENTLSSLDQPGEWVLDTANRRIYLWPAGDRPGDDIVVPALTELIRLEGEIDYDGPVDKPVRGLIFRGLTFTQADRFAWEKDRTGWGLQHDWEMFDRPTAMVRMRGAEGCSIEECRFTNAGASAIRLDLHCRRNRIDGNVIEHVGGVGILLAGYGPGTKDVNRENRVTRNRIHHVGELYWHSPAIFLWQSGDNLVGNNLIHNTPYSAIVVSGRIVWDRSGNAECSRTVRWHEVGDIPEPDDRDWYTRERFLHGRGNQIFRNEIHHAVEVMTDGNGVYISGAGADNVVRENYIHDCPSRQFGEGIRCDDDQHETVIDRNVLWRLGGFATFVCIKGKNNVTGNIFACPLTPPKRGMLSLEPTNTPLTGSVIQRNLFYSTRKGDKIYYKGKNDFGAYASMSDCEADLNLYHNTADPEWGNRHLAAEREAGSEMGSIAVNPLFLNEEDGDLNVENHSPAKALGFTNIDLGLIGLPRLREKVDAATLPSVR
jgi:hypothetical protein